MYSLHQSQAKVLNLPGRVVKVLVGNGKLSSKHMTLGITEVPPQSSMTPHAHQGEEEIIVIIQGFGEVNVGGTTEKLEPSTAVVFPDGVTHAISNMSNDVMRFVFCFYPCHNFG